MPTSNYDSFGRWLDGIFGATYKPVKLVFEGEKQLKVNPFEIQSVLSNRKKNAFTVVWTDGTSTVVHCQPGDEWDDEKALAMCFTKKALGNKGNFNDKFNDTLDNKMKVIPAEPAPEKACACDGKRDDGIHSCIECKCKEESEVDKALAKEFVKKSIETANAFGISKDTVDKLAKETVRANNSLEEMINMLTGKATPKTNKTETTPLYRVFIRISGVSHHDSDFTSIPALRKRVHEIAEEHYGRKPYYYRTWMSGGRMQIDFGHYTQFIEVEGITPDEFAKN